MLLWLGKGYRSKQCSRPGRSPWNRRMLRAFTVVLVGFLIEVPGPQRWRRQQRLDQRGVFFISLSDRYSIRIDWFHVVNSLLSKGIPQTAGKNELSRALSWNAFRFFFSRPNFQRPGHGTWNLVCFQLGHVSAPLDLFHSFWEMGCWYSSAPTLACTRPPEHCLICVLFWNVDRFGPSNPLMWPNRRAFEILGVITQYLIVIAQYK